MSSGLTVLRFWNTAHSVTGYSCLTKEGLRIWEPMRRFLIGKGFTRSSGTRRRSIIRREDIYFKTNYLLVICLMKLYNKKSVYKPDYGPDGRRRRSHELSI